MPFVRRDVVTDQASMAGTHACDETYQAGGRVPIQRSVDAARPGDTPRIMGSTGA
jgi:hypothetical protein